MSCSSFVGPQQPWKFSEILRKLPAAAAAALNGDEENVEDINDAGVTTEKYEPSATAAICWPPRAARRAVFESQMLKTNQKKKRNRKGKNQTKYNKQLANSCHRPPI